MAAPPSGTPWVILGRLAFACIFSLSIYHFAPLSLEMRQVLAVTVFAPVSTLAPIYTEKCKGDTAVSSFTASVSIVIGLFVMSGLAMWFRLWRRLQHGYFDNPCFIREINASGQLQRIRILCINPHSSEMEYTSLLSGFAKYIPHAGGRSFSLGPYSASTSSSEAGGV